MRIEHAIERDYHLEVCIDGYYFTSDTKYTILELGYAVYLMKDPDEDWLEKNGDIVPPDPDDNRPEIRSGHGMLVTADPTLVALAYESWWNRNGIPHPRDTLLPIPLTYEAVEIVRKRRILNEFNRKWAGAVPGLQNISTWRPMHQNTRENREQKKNVTKLHHIVPFQRSKSNNEVCR